MVFFFPRLFSRPTRVLARPNETVRYNHTGSLSLALTLVSTDATIASHRSPLTKLGDSGNDGVVHDTSCEVRWAFQVGRVAALVEQTRDPKSLHPNSVAPEIPSVGRMVNLYNP